MPTLFESSAKVGNMRSSLINRFGLETKVEIFAGGADNACAAIGAGIVNSEVAMLSIGTSGVFCQWKTMLRTNIKVISTYLIQLCLILLLHGSNVGSR